jgi:hypothetical protein
MVIGDKKTFAIEYSITRKVIEPNGHDWVYGTFVWYLQNRLIGRKDEVLIVTSCAYWMQNIIGRIIDIKTPFSTLSASQLIETYRAKSVIDLSDYDSVEKATEYVLSLSHNDIGDGIYLYQSTDIGTIWAESSINMTLLMVDGTPGYKRFVYQHEKEPPEEFFVKTNTIKLTISDFTDSFSKSLEKIPRKLVFIRYENIIDGQIKYSYVNLDSLSLNENVDNDYSI